MQLMIPMSGERSDNKVYFGGERSKGFATLRNVSKLTFLGQDWERKVCRFSVLLGYLTK